MTVSFRLRPRGASERYEPARPLILPANAPVPRGFEPTGRARERHGGYQGEPGADRTQIPNARCEFRDHRARRLVRTQRSGPRVERRSAPGRGPPALGCGSNTHFGSAKRRLSIWTPFVYLDSVRRVDHPVGDRVRSACVETRSLDAFGWVVGSGSSVASARTLGAGFSRRRARMTQR